jgi:molybdate transport system substrate-binding protein
MIRLLMTCSALCAGTAALAAERVTVAVATNFYETLATLEPIFEANHDIDLVLVSGASGTLYAQISHGAPYDVFLSADQARPNDVYTAGLGSEPVTYVYGQLVLWGLADDVDASTLADPDLRFVALASPSVAPYGLAAEQTIASLGLTDALANKQVLGQNIGQTFAMASTGAADVAFIAKSAALASDAAKDGTYWVIPHDLYAPITQDATVIKGRNEQDAQTFLDFLASDAARDIIRDHGYEVPSK